MALLGKSTHALVAAIALAGGLASAKCKPATCAGIAATCGNPSDGCGGALSCGTCALPQTCNASYACVCAPRTCAAAAATCGAPTDGCGGTLACGSCPNGQTCDNTFHCAVVPQPIANVVRFAAGSLMLPMDACYNPDGGLNATPNDSGTGCVASPSSWPCYASGTTGNVRLPFGMVYLFAVNNIPVSVILKPDKIGLGDPDLTVTPPTGAVAPTSSYLAWSGTGYSIAPAKITSGTKPIYYAGMPFVIDAAFADQALQLLTRYNLAPSAPNSCGASATFSTVPLHVINYDFSAPVLATLASRPKPVLVSGAPLDGFFCDSNIPGVVNGSYAVVSGSGASWSFTWPSAALGANPACPGDRCSTLVFPALPSPQAERIVDVIWSNPGDVNNWSAIPDWYRAGGTAFVVGNATGWEAAKGGQLGGGIYSSFNGAVKGPFCAANPGPAATPFANPGTTTYHPASNPFLQVGNMDLSVAGGGGGDGSSYLFSNPAAASLGTATLVSPDRSAYSAIAGQALVGGVQQSGNIVYLGSLNSWSGGASGKSAGLRLMYNTLVARNIQGQQQFQRVELSRSSPVGLSTGEYYLGTFDWQIPLHPAEGGNVLYQPLASTYPYVTGHFREYTAGSASTTLACTPGNASNCSWDAALQIRAFANRNIYVGKSSGGSYSLVPAASLADSTIAFLKANLDIAGAQTAPFGKLGGVDWATAAVIENRPNGQVTVAGAKGRPTIAYVGARDGMLHAFCVKPASGSSDCYGFNPGDEIWAIIPPGVKAQMDAALVAQDWSAVNVGGLVRVADISDTFSPSVTSSYKTVLLVGTRDSGHIDAFDVSNPAPSNVNQEGFRLLWENDGTNVAGTAAYKIGRTMGATIASTGSYAGVAVVTSSITPPAGSTSAGINTYVMRLGDGKVISVDQKLYLRARPLSGGGTAPLPNDVPAVATTLDTDGDGVDESLYVADFEGMVRKLTLSATAPFALTATQVLYDASATCAGAVACQPLGAPPTIARYGAAGTTLAAFVATGGADWARSASRTSWMLGFDAKTGAAIISSPLPTVTLPAGPPPGGQAVAMPVRGYAQLTASGTDLLGDFTTLAVGSVNQLALPEEFPGSYGTVLRWGNLSSTIDAAPSYEIAKGTTFAGGVAPVLEINNAEGGGTLTLLGADYAIRMAAPQTALASSVHPVEPSNPGTRPFSVLTWFDLND